MRILTRILLVLALLLASHPLQAQRDTASAAPLVPGQIRGLGGRPGSGEIHVVGQTKGDQKIHFTEAFKVEASPDLRAILSLSLTVGAESADIGPIRSTGDQLLNVPATVDFGSFATLLVYDARAKRVIAMTPLPNAKGQAYSSASDSSATRRY